MKVVVTQSNAIKKKLMAATSMLLVAVIMLVSSTYAWFTLSTAPEVTGITTTVGANGNLEMALAYTGVGEDGEPIDTWNTDDPGTVVGASMDVLDDDSQANITWGNLVDVSDSTQYGLDKISLLPSRLNIGAGDADNGYTVGAAMLQTPTFGTDGRVSGLNANSSTGTYIDGKGGFVVDDAAYGVRAVGVASALTERQLAYRNAVATVTSNKITAKNVTRNSLIENGTALASVIMKHATAEGDNDRYTQADLDIMLKVVEDLGKSTTYIKKAWDATLIGLVTSAEGEAKISEEIALAISSAIESGTAQVAVSGNDITISVTVSGTDGDTTKSETITNEVLANMYSKYNSLESSVTTANGKLTALKNAGSDEMTWSQIKEPLTYLVNPDKVTVNGIPTGELKARISELITAVTSGQGIRVQMPTEAGAYADVADFCGDYVADIMLKDLSYGGVGPISTAAFMETQSTVKPCYLDLAKLALDTAKAPSNASTAEAILTDYYGYAVDLLFRTNAADSELQLQVDEAQRIYSDSENAATQGSGSNMTFASENPSFTADNVKALMDAIRVVFMDTQKNIIGVAKLDVYQRDENGNIAMQDGKPLYKAEDTAEGAKADLVLHDFTIAADGVITMGQPKESQSLMALPQNTKIQLTALVYLDGDVVTNAMVANAASSMKGTMNLQFSSTATLVPMKDTSLMGTTSDEPENP